MTETVPVQVIPAHNFAITATQYNFFLTIQLFQPTFTGAAAEKDARVRNIASFDLSPGLLKDLYKALGRTVADYEARYGEIPWTPPKEAPKVVQLHEVPKPEPEPISVPVACPVCGVAPGEAHNDFAHARYRPPTQPFYEELNRPVPSRPMTFSEYQDARSLLVNPPPLAFPCTICGAPAGGQHESTCRNHPDAPRPVSESPADPAPPAQP